MPTIPGYAPAAGAHRFADPRWLYGTVLSDGLLIFIIICILIMTMMSFAFGFLAVRYRRQNEKMAKRWAELEAVWKPLIVASLAGDKTAVEVWEHVHQKDRLYFVDFLTRYAKRFRGDELQKITELARPYLPDVAAHLHLKSQGQRGRAVQALGLLGFRFYVEDIVKALDDEAPLVAMIAARTLSKQEHPQYVGQVIDRMYRFETWSPVFLASMLSAVGPEAAPVLRAAMADRTKPLMARSIAAEALCRLNDLQAADVAAGVLQEEFELESAMPPQPEGKAPRSAFATAASAPGPAAKGKESPQGVLGAESPAQMPESGTRLVKSLDDRPHPHRDLIASCMRLLRSMGRPEHVEKVRYFCDSRDFVIKALSCWALGRIGNESDVPRLEAALDDPASWSALHAAQALRQLGASQRLQQIASSEHPHADLARQVLAEATI